MKRWLQDYAPLSAAAVRRILQFDWDAGYGLGGEMPNRNRFYHYLTQRGSDVQIRTVAVKAKNKTTQPMVKEVVRASADDPWIYVHDLGFCTIRGYFVDWYSDGIGFDRGFNYGRRWELSAYALRCMWKIHAPVVNPELLKRTRRFRWSAWEQDRGHLLDYLKVYKEHPEIELLSKCGLGRFCTKISIVRKLKADRNFRQFFMTNAEYIKKNLTGIDVIMKAFHGRIPLSEAYTEIRARKVFWRGYSLPSCICPVKAFQYVEKFNIFRSVYTAYLHNCQKAGLDLADTKVSFPKQFKARSSIVQDMADVIRRQEKAEEIEKMNLSLAAVAEKWSRFERNGRNYRIVIPRSEQEFIDAGRAMSNCLGGYAARVSRGELVVVFVRLADHPRKAFVAAAYDPKSKEVTQCYGVKNSKPPKPVADFVQRVFYGTTTSKLKVAA